MVFTSSGHTRKAFSLVELLIVISIIGLLSSVVLASLSTARTRSRDSNRIQEISSIQKALELYYSDKGYYPNSLSITEMTNYISDPTAILSGPKGDTYWYVALKIVPSGTVCSAANQLAQSYHLLATLEAVPAGTGVLSVDADAAAEVFPGYSCGAAVDQSGIDAAPCGQTNSAVGTCYDVKP